MTGEFILTNDVLTVTVSSIGAELLSVKKDNEERIWPGDPDFWDGRAPLLFPICGRLKDDKYIYDDKEYNLEYHGYGRFLEFDIEKIESQSIVFLHRYNSKTLELFPFEYELRVVYKLENSSLKITYIINNLGDKDMFFSIGSHEGLYCPEGICEYSVVFEKPESLDCVVCSADYFGHDVVNKGNDVKEFYLNDKYFENGSLSFINLKSKNFTLINRRTGKTTVLKTDNNYSVFTLWSVPNAGFICLEPWYGMPDFIDSDYNIINKEGIITLPKHEQKTISHEFSF